MIVRNHLFRWANILIERIYMKMKYAQQWDKMKYLRKVHYKLKFATNSNVQANHAGTKMAAAEQIAAKI